MNSFPTKGSSDFIFSSTATKQLVASCCSAEWNPKLQEVRKYVLQGANICEMVPLSPLKKESLEEIHSEWKRHEETSISCCKPLLSWLIEAKSIANVLCCLIESPVASFDFTLADEEGLTPLHAMCCPTVRDEDTVVMVEAFLNRLETHPEDLFDWSQRVGLCSENGFLLSETSGNDALPRVRSPTEEERLAVNTGKCSFSGGIGEDIVQFSASSQKLHLVWPIIRTVPCFEDLLHPIFLQRVFLWDWQQLSSDHQHFLSVEKAEIIVANQSTGRLLVYCVWTKWKTDPKEVYRCVQDGADVCFSSIHMRMPLLQRLILLGDVEAVRACCSISFDANTPRMIDWTVGDVEGNTPLHAICFLPSHASDTVSRILTIVLDRLALMSPSLFLQHTLHNTSPPEKERQSPCACQNRKKSVVCGAECDSVTSTSTSDLVDFLQENKHGDTFFSLAAAFGHLSMVWGMLKERGVAPFPMLRSPVYSCSSASPNSSVDTENKKIILNLQLHDELDWNNLSSEDKHFFVRMISPPAVQGEK